MIIKKTSRTTFISLTFYMDFFSGFTRTYLGICLLLWKHQKPKTEAFSKDFLEEVDKLSTERSFVSDLFGVFLGRN